MEKFSLVVCCLMIGVVVAQHNFVLRPRVDGDEFIFHDLVVQSGLDAQNTPTKRPPTDRNYRFRWVGEDEVFTGVEMRFIVTGAQVQNLHFETVDDDHPWANRTFTVSCDANTILLTAELIVHGYFNQGPLPLIP